MGKSHCYCDKLTVQPKVGLLERLLLRLVPHFDIIKTIRTPTGPEVSLYLRRFYLWRSKWVGKNWGDLYLHKICRSDDDPDPHDHPWGFRTTVLRGSYRDEAWESWEPGEISVEHDGVWFQECVPYTRVRTSHADEVLSAGMSRRRPRTHIHRVILDSDRPAWTLVQTSSYRLDDRGDGDWAFYTSNKRVPWRRYLGLEGEYGE